MEICRACLLSGSNMFLFDEYFLNYYNLFTNLNVTLCDGLPQYTCHNCVEVLKIFIEFRTKAIASETTLRELIEDAKPKDLQHETKHDTENNMLKFEIKTETNLEPSCNEDFLCDQFIEDNVELDDKDLIEFDTQNLENRKRNNYISKKKKIVKTDKYLLDSCKGPKKEKNKKKRITEIVEDFLSCGLCPLKFEEKTALKNHLETHKKYTQCELCQERFSSWQQTLGHRIQHIPMKERRCHVCNKRYATCAGLEYHYLCIHSEKQDTSLKCKICLKSYGNPSKLKKHISYAHSTTISIYICDHCSKRFSSKHNLRSHILSHLNIKPFACKLCVFSCKLRTGLTDHMIRKHSSDKVTCKKCTRIFKNQQDHDKHNCSVKYFVCPICGKEMNTRKGTRFNRHMATHEPVGRYKCARCPSVYRTKEALSVHVNRHDGVRSYKCERCPASFYSASSRIRHRRIHTGEKPYVCNICSKGFMSNSNLKTHMKVHGLFVINHKNKDTEKKTENV